MHVASDDGRLRPGGTFPFMKYSPGRYGAHEASRPEPDTLEKKLLIIQSWVGSGGS